MSPIAAVRAHAVTPSRGVAKPRGVDNAEVQHQRHAEKKSVAQPSPAAVVTLGETPAPGTYPRPARPASTPASADTLGGGRAGSTPGGVPTATAGASSTTHVADGARVHVNARGDSSSGGGTLIVGEGASVHVNARGDSSSGGGTLIVGEGASVHVNARGDAAATGASVPDGSSVKQPSRAENEPAARSTSTAAGPEPTAWRPFSAAAYRTAQRGGATPEPSPQPEPAPQRAPAAPANPREAASGHGFSARHTRRGSRGAAKPEDTDPRLHLLRELVAKDVREPKAAQRAEASKASDVKEDSGRERSRGVDDPDARGRDEAVKARQEPRAAQGVKEAREGVAPEGAAPEGAAGRKGPEHARASNDPAPHVAARSRV